MSATVVLLHAMGASRRMWRAQFDALAGRYELIAPDLPGHGQRPGPFSLESAVDDLAGIVDEHVAPVYLVGVSLGGAVALRYALDRPQRVAGLVLSGTPLRPNRFALWAQLAVTAVLPIASAATTSARMVRPADRGDEDAFIADIIRAGKGTQMRALRELARADESARLPEIGARTLVCCGSEDRANLPAARELAAGIPAATLRVIEGGGHLWNLQRPDLCTEIIADFLTTP